MRFPLLNDMHVHLRQGDMLKAVTPHTAKRVGHALVMPNTLPAITTPEDVHRYFKEIVSVAWTANDRFKPLMTCKLTPQTTPELVRQLKDIGLTAFKLYPEGVTTNSEGGIGADDLHQPTVAFLDCLAEMERQRIVLCLHGEMPGVFCLDRESAFIPFVKLLRNNFPRLKIVMEHITTADAVSFVNEQSSDYLAATITLHHLYLTLDDVIGDKIQPHHFCKPVAKRDGDKQALILAALSDNSQFFFGSDSAPHAKNTKENACGCAGVYTAPVMLELLLQFFDEAGELQKLVEFGTMRAARFYDLPENGLIEVVRKPWKVPEEIDGVVPFFADKEIRWSIA